MKRLMHFAYVPAVVLLVGCADGLPTAAPDGADAVAAVAATVEVAPVEVPIDVKPEAVNAGEITIRPNNRLAVALVVNEAIDVELVDITTLVFTVGDVSLTGLMHNLENPSAFTSHLKDVFPVLEPDGVIDYLVLHFDPEGLRSLGSGAFSACLTGVADGIPFVGCEDVTVR